MDYPVSDPTVGLVGGKFTDGNPAGGIPASRDPSSWANLVTDELLGLLTEAGIVPSDADNTQVLAAVIAIITKQFTGTNQGSGFQKFPGGMILQWGTTPITAAANTLYTASLPITFPTNARAIVALFSNYLSPSSFVNFNMNFNPTAGSGPASQYRYSASASNSQAFFLAVGY